MTHGSKSLSFKSQPIMKRITGYISTGMRGSTREFEFEAEDDCTPEELEEMARDAAFELIEWNYKIDGNSPD